MLGGWLSWHECASPSPEPAALPASEHLPRPRPALLQRNPCTARLSPDYSHRGPLLCLPPPYLHPRITDLLLLRPYRKILKSACAISNGAWRSHFFQIPRSLSSLTLPALPPITLGISSGIAWVSCSRSLRHCLSLHTIHQTMLPVFSHR